MGRTFPVTHHRERRPEVDEDRAKVLVLSTYDDTRESVLRCGELLSAVLLDATMVGLATCTLTHITEVSASREIVAGLIDQSNQGHHTPGPRSRRSDAIDRGRASPDATSADRARCSKSVKDQSLRSRAFRPSAARRGVNRVETV